MTDSPATAALIRRGRRVADYLRGDCFAVCVVQRHAEGAAQGAPDSRTVAEHLDFARRLHIETRTLIADDAARALVAFARAEAVTQIFLPRPARRLLALLSRRHTTMRVVAPRARHAGDRRGRAEEERSVGRRRWSARARLRTRMAPLFEDSPRSLVLRYAAAPRASPRSAQAQGLGVVEEAAGAVPKAASCGCI